MPKVCVHAHFGTVHTLFTSYDTVHTHFDIVHTHFGTVRTLFTSYDTVHTHLETVHTHFDTVHTLFTSYDTVPGADPGISKGGCTIRDIHVYIIQSVLA